MKNNGKALYGNCDEFLYLGGNEQSTHKDVSQLLGKETIDINTYGKSSGRSGNYSTNYQISGRELMTPDEVRLLDNKYALLFIRGERPVMDFKYDILKHPNVQHTTDGKGKPYIHGGTEQSIATITLSEEIKDDKFVDIQDLIDIDEIKKLSENCEVLTEEEIEERIFKGGF